uniref:Uncharacterized protein n=1 Tax=Arundo donax TaxID=35708 RepID=A0A0A9FJ93_ARUDO
MMLRFLFLALSFRRSCGMPVSLLWDLVLLDVSS